MKIHPKTRKEYDQLCDETMAYFRKLMEEYPQITMYKSIYIQIWMIRKDLAEDIHLDIWKDMQKYSLGAIVARNFDEEDVYGKAIGSIYARSFIYFDMPKDELRTSEEMLAFTNKTIALMEQPFDEYYLNRKYKAEREELTPYIEEARRVLMYVKDYLEHRNDGSELEKIDLKECSNKTYLDFRYAVSFSMYEVIPAIIERLRKMREEDIKP